MAESPFSDDLDLDFLNWASGLSGAESAETLSELENLFVEPGESVDLSAHSDSDRDITGESELPPSNVAFLFGEPEVAPPEVQESADGWGELERFLSDSTPQESVDLSAHSDSDRDITGESELPPSNVAFLFGEPEVAPPEVQESADGWGELERFLSDSTPQESVDLSAHSDYSDTDITGESELPSSNVAFLFGEPEVAPPEVQESPAQELPLPPPLWAEIGHLFQTPAFNEATPNQPANPAIASEIDTLSQAMLANDGDTIQTLVQQIQETYDELKSIEIFLAATRNLCY
ncbi:hypothetical protein [Synechococcus sp. C9]|uniref:hypothetical protein n=1 Tax=Synechococcus sp. C9 TaxID=102119 RepID=UPI001FF232C1|nr:hypothetical protein [Synechococcus sp. C9]